VDAAGGRGSQGFLSALECDVPDVFHAAKAALAASRE